MTSRRASAPASIGRASLCFFLLALIDGIGMAPPGRASPASLAAKLHSESLGRVTVSIAFEPLAGEDPSVEVDPNRPLPPASVEKLVTSAAAIDLLGPSHRYMTRLATDRAVRGARVEGNIYVTGGGDPFLVTERLWLLAHAVASHGIRAISGDLVVAAQTIADLDSVRSKEESASPYTAPVSLLAVNFNNVAFLVRPGGEPAAPAVVLFDPFPVPGLTLLNRATTGAAGSSPTVGASRSGDTWTVQGSVPIDSSPTWVYKAATNPALLAGSVLRGLLAQEGVEISGKIREGAASSATVPLDSLPSLELGTLARSMNEWSNNFMADLVLVSLGDGSSARSGIETVLRWLRERPGITDLPAIRDGSGLSVENRISAGAIVRILKWASREERVFPDLYASLARPGEEGTLQRRFRDGPAPALRAKTGTLGDHGVSSIAGYVDLPSGERYAFCILQRSEDPQVGVSELRDREERWLREFVTP